jgi:hypothetical protein
MRSVLQRVSRAKVTVSGQLTGEIGPGLLILLGVGKADTSAISASFAEKIANLRMFEDDQQKMNRSLLDVKAPPSSSRNSLSTATPAASVGPASSPPPRPIKPKPSTKNFAPLSANSTSP